jgi:hypothetical protein
MAGDPAAARDQHAALLPIFERVLGPEHPFTLTARDTSPGGHGPQAQAPTRVRNYGIMRVLEGINAELLPTMGHRVMPLTWPIVVTWGDLGAH